MFDKLKKLIEEIKLKITSKKDGKDVANTQAKQTSVKPSTSLDSNVAIDAAQISKKSKKSQDMMFFGVLGLILIILLIVLQYQSAPVVELDENGNKPNIKLEVASNALDSEKMWRNYFEDKLLDHKEQSISKLKIIENNLNDQSKEYQDKAKGEIDLLKEQMKFLNDEFNASRRELSNLKNSPNRNQAESAKPTRSIDEARINVNPLDRGDFYDRPKSSRHYIPETSYVKGVLLGGIAVSTSLGSSAEPVPIVIKLTDKGSLPKNFDIDFKQCKIMGSAYGDISSERAIIRAETLSCQDVDKELIYTTRIAGLVHGDDGYNGIKGRVVQTSAKHLRNAMFGSVLSGFSGAVKDKGSSTPLVNITGATNKKQPYKDMLSEGAFAGVGNAGEKLADYYIKQAEAMSPILLVSGGVKVDVVFTKGVYFAALDVEEQIRQSRVQSGRSK